MSLYDFVSTNWVPPIVWFGTVIVCGENIEQQANDIDDARDHHVVQGTKAHLKDRHHPRRLPRPRTIIHPIRKVNIYS